MIARLIFDIEVSPNIGFFWNVGNKISVGYDNIIEERKIICICYKWEGKKTIYSLRWDKNKCDKKMIAEFIKIASKADELCGHNGDRFDIVWIRTRALMHGLNFTTNIVSVDTLKEARKSFRFNSNRLDYIGKILVSDKKDSTDFGMWRDIVLTNNKRQLDKMVKYCKKDVLLLEKVLQKLKPFIKPKSSIALTKKECPECGSESFYSVGVRRTAAGTAYVRGNCGDCGKYYKIPLKNYENAIV